MGLAGVCLPGPLRVLLRLQPHQPCGAVIPRGPSCLVIGAICRAVAVAAPVARGAVMRRELAGASRLQGPGRFCFFGPDGESLRARRAPREAEAASICTGLPVAKRPCREFMQAPGHLYLRAVWGGNRGRSTAARLPRPAARQCAVNGPARHGRGEHLPQSAGLGGLPGVPAPPATRRYPAGPGSSRKREEPHDHHGRPEPPAPVSRHVEWQETGTIRVVGGRHRDPLG